MDPIKNPFSPGAGSPPPELVGRDPILDQARILLGRVKKKRVEKSMMLTGLRGVGKTVLLNEIERLAKADAYHTISIEAHEEKPLGALITPYLRTLLFDLDRRKGVWDLVFGFCGFAGSGPFPVFATCPVVIQAHSQTIADQGEKKDGHCESHSSRKTSSTVSSPQPQ